MLRCLSNADGNAECRAITIGTSAGGRCSLVTRSIADVGTQTASYSGFQSFSRPDWYIGKQWPSVLYESLVLFKCIFTSSISKP